MCEDERYNRIHKQKLEVLKVLGPLGFTDNEDDEYPEAIYHPGISQTFDCRTINLANVIKTVFDLGNDLGQLEAQRRVRVALGL